MLPQNIFKENSVGNIWRKRQKDTSERFLQNTQTKKEANMELNCIINSIYIDVLANFI